MKTILKIWLMGIMLCTAPVHADNTGSTDDPVDESGYYEDNSGNADTEVSPACSCEAGSRDDYDDDYDDGDSDRGHRRDDDRRRRRDLSFGVSIGGQNGNGLGALLTGIMSGILMGNNNNNNGQGFGMYPPVSDPRFAPQPYDGRYYQPQQPPSILPPYNPGMNPGGGQTAPIFAPYINNTGTVYNGNQWWMGQQNTGGQWNTGTNASFNPGPAPAILPYYTGQVFNQTGAGQPPAIVNPR